MNLNGKEVLGRRDVGSADIIPTKNRNSDPPITHPSSMKRPWIRKRRCWFRTRVQELLRNRTALIIAHRLSTIKNADRILVIAKARSGSRARTRSCWRAMGSTRASTSCNIGHRIEKRTAEPMVVLSLRRGGFETRPYRAGARGMKIKGDRLVFCRFHLLISFITGRRGPLAGVNFCLSPHGSCLILISCRLSSPPSKPSICRTTSLWLPDSTTSS